jgi:Nucleotidyl transferase of unknown function (DUF2204)
LPPLKQTTKGYDPCTMTPTEAPIEAPADVPVHCVRLREALRSAASALKENGPRFALAGSYALWAYGAPEPSHDVDLVVAESDVANAEATLSDAGFMVEHPPEDWLFKARTGGTVVDVLHRINGVRVAQAILGCAEERDVLAIGMPVLPPTIVVIQNDRGDTKAALPRRASLRLREAASGRARGPRTAGLGPHQDPDRR